jgi:hypothetical protein
LRLEACRKRKAAEPPPPRDGYIYFITAPECGYPVKIGFSETAGGILERLESLQTGNPRPLVVGAFLKGSMREEAGWHLQFANDRLSGEWFKRSSTLLSQIKRRARLVAFIGGAK